MIKVIVVSCLLLLPGCATLKDAALGALGGSNGGISASASYEKTEGTKNERIETNGSKEESSVDVKANTIGEVSHGRSSTHIKGEQVTNHTVYDKLPTTLIVILIVLMLLGWVLPTPTTMWKAWRKKDAYL